MRCALLLIIALAACDREAQTADDADDPCGPADDVERGARTTGAAAKAGAETAVEGVKTFGESVGGFVDGGSSEAKDKWDAGAARTRSTAKAGGEDTKSTAHTKPCR